MAEESRQRTDNSFFVKKEEISGVLSLIEPELSLLAKNKKAFEEIEKQINEAIEKFGLSVVTLPDGDREIIYYDKAMYANESIQRATYIGNTLYTVSAHRICSYPIEGGKVIATLDF